MVKKSSKIQTYICFVLDSSGSMISQQDRVIAGFNEFLSEQKKIKDNSSLTLVQFDTTATTIYLDVDLAKAEDLSRKSYNPKGFTALYDAVGTTIKSIENKVGKTDRVIVAIFTDGQENSSHEYSSSTIRKMITEKEGQGNWTFTFMGVDKDSWAVGQTLGIQKGNIAALNLNDVRVSTQFAARAITNYRSTNNLTSSTMYNSKENK